MPELSNHPVFKHPVSLKVKFEDFDHTVVFEGTHSFREVLKLLKRVGYIDESIERIKIQVILFDSDCANILEFFINQLA